MLLGLLTALVGSLSLSAKSPAEDLYFDSNGVKLRYVTAGRGETVVLIHGWMSDATMWGVDASGNPKVDMAGMDGFQVVTFDCRGHGKSDKPHDRSAYGAEMARDVVRLLDHLKIKRAHLVGYSMGSFLAGTVTATYPDRVISTIYGGQSPLIKGVHDLKFGDAELFANLVDEGKGLGGYILAVSPSNLKPTPEQAEGYARFLFGKKDVKAYAASGRSFKDLAVSRDKLRASKAPSLFVYGKDESDYVKENIALARKVLPDSQVKVIDAGNHMTTLTKPAFGEAIQAFIHANRRK